MHDVKQLPLRGPVAGSSYLKAAQMPWQPTEDKKFWIKPLYEDVDRGEKTFLVLLHRATHMTTLSSSSY